MSKLLLGLLLCMTFLLSTLQASYNTKKNHRILKELDIDKSFINDDTLQEMYYELLERNHLHHYKLTLKRSSAYISKIQEVLIKEGLPKSFLFLSMAESNFQIDAKSYTGALGLWQFMPKTAQLFDLRLDDYVDERLDFIKSTKAASKYLSYHHDRFKKWYLAILAYNSGEGRIIEALTRATLDKYLVINPNKKNSVLIKEYKNTLKEYMATKKNFYKVNKIYKATRKWRIPLTATDLIRIQDKIDRQYLPKESRIYLRKILALAMVSNEKVFQKSNIFIRRMDSSLTTIRVKGGIHLRSLSKIINMKFSELTKLNRHIKQYILPIDVKYYDVNIPYKKLKLYNRNKNKIKNNTFIVHIVKKGDTLSSIGSKYKVKYSFIKNFNELKSNRLKLKQKLIIPIEKKSNKKRKIKSSKKNKKTSYNKITHIVKKGQSLSSIAQKYKVSIKDLKRINKLKNSKIKLDEKLIIPGKKITYKVKNGDSLSTIAYKFKVNIKDLKRDNKFKSNKIKVGDKIEIYK